MNWSWVYRAPSWPICAVCSCAIGSCTCAGACQQLGRCVTCTGCCPCKACCMCQEGSAQAAELPQRMLTVMRVWCGTAWQNP